MQMDEITLTEMLKEIFEHNKQVQEFIEKQQEKDKIINAYQQQTELLIESFNTKFSNIKVDAPKPDISSVNQALTNGLQVINQTIAKGPKPVERVFRLTLFPEQVRNAEYYGIMLTRLILGVLGIMALILGYMLLNKMIR
ncbi:hypothetical protein BDD43_1980 [Mucilaginibacter gracilis]|uniref:Uncharacterized protein n=2 Tax=Mucilaginibacter gracilis TaxID=423350 RepID=A0A495IZ90_9SPHI|nr:hypothetical protein BDD43_1980 [Mucilaginibacter gracilis]